MRLLKMLDCPFCGGRARSYVDKDSYGYYGTVSCKDCKIGTGIHHNKSKENLLDEMWGYWDRRVDGKEK